MEKYDRWIMAEDDIEFSPVFLEYMNKCLDLFEDDPEVFAVNGYTYPVTYKVSEGSNVVKQFATVSEWGIGYWRKKYLAARDRIQNDYLREQFTYAAKTGILDRMVNSGSGPDRAGHKQKLSRLSGCEYSPDRFDKCLRVRHRPEKVSLYR